MASYKCFLCVPKMKFSSHEKYRKIFQLFFVKFLAHEEDEIGVEKPQKREKHVFKPFGKHDRAFFLECLSWFYSINFSRKFSCRYENDDWKKRAIIQMLLCRYSDWRLQFFPSMSREKKSNKSLITNILSLRKNVQH